MTLKPTPEGGTRSPSGNADAKHLPGPPADKAIHGPMQTKTVSSASIRPKPDRR